MRLMPAAAEYGCQLRTVDMRNSILPLDALFTRHARQRRPRGRRTELKLLSQGYGQFLRSDEVDEVQFYHA